MVGVAVVWWGLLGLCVLLTLITVVATILGLW